MPFSLTRRCTPGLGSPGGSKSGKLHHSVAASSAIQIGARGNCRAPLGAGRRRIPAGEGLRRSKACSGCFVSQLRMRAEVSTSNRLETSATALSVHTVDIDHARMRVVGADDVRACARVVAEDIVDRCCPPANLRHRPPLRPERRPYRAHSRATSRAASVSIPR